ncbi:MAG: hypothetical protein WEF50_07565 [Myxococcota bacterium]
MGEDRVVQHLDLAFGQELGQRYGALGRERCLDRLEVGPVGSTHDEGKSGRASTRQRGELPDRTDRRAVDLVDHQQNRLVGDDAQPLQQRELCFARARGELPEEETKQPAADRFGRLGERAREADADSRRPLALREHVEQHRLADRGRPGEQYGRATRGEARVDFREGALAAL